MPTDSTQHPPGRVRELFDELIELPAEERARRIAALELPQALEHRLRALLDADPAHAAVLDTSAVETIEQLRDDRRLAERLIGTRVGSFQLLSLIGQGGTSVVFRAERAVGQTTQTVALKLMRTGLFSTEAQRRFGREQTILAQLTHPHIARLIEGGVSDSGVPYIAMEFVDGVPITRYADARALGLVERLRLFVTLCRAVDAAHAALVVHRDLKPSNVYVDTQGALKVLDFGIAKLLDDDAALATRTQAIMLTPEYAAPEQFHSGPITIAADVYALGVMLGELLTGELLGRGNTGNASTAAAGSHDRPAPRGLPERPLLARRLRGDLDAIVATALAEEPARRYRSAAALADDIERHLDGRPVTAHPPSGWYRARKFIGRHRGGVLTTVALMLAVVAALGVAVWQARVAQMEAQRANLVRDFLIELFDSARAQLPRDARPTPDVLIKAALKRVGDNTVLDPQTRADLLQSLAQVSLSAADPVQAEALFARALAVREQALPDRREAIVHLHVLRASALQEAGDNAQAVAIVDGLLPELRAAGGPTTVDALGVLAAAKIALGVPDEAIANSREAAALAARIYPPESRAAVGAAIDLGGTLEFAKRFPEAIAQLEPALARWRAAGLPQDNQYLSGLGNLAVAQSASGNQAASEAKFRELLALTRRIYDAPHDEIATALNNLGLILVRSGKFDEAERLLRESLAMTREVFGEEHEQVAAGNASLAMLVIEQRRFDEALVLHLQAVATCAQAQVNSETCWRARSNLGINYLRLGRFDDARRELEAALVERRRALGNDHPSVGSSLAALAQLDIAQGRAEQALRGSADALAIFERAGRGNSLEGASIRHTRAEALHLSGRHEDALREVALAASDWQRTASGRKARQVQMLALQARILRVLGRTREASAIVAAAIAVDAPANQLDDASSETLREMGGRIDPSH